jgi:hypothetical protein
VTDYAWLDDWHAFLEAVEYEAELRGRAFDVWAALAEALHEWLDEYEGSPPRSSDLTTKEDPLGTALQRMRTMVPPADVPGGFRIGAVIAGAISTWSEARLSGARSIT